MDQVRVLEEERDALRRLLRQVREENECYKCDDVRDKILALEPLVVPKMAKKRVSRGQ
jgi:uncharacterized membrane protein